MKGTSFRMGEFAHPFPGLASIIRHILPIELWSKVWSRNSAKARAYVGPSTASRLIRAGKCCSIRFPSRLTMDPSLPWSAQNTTQGMPGGVFERDLVAMTHALSHSLPILSTVPFSPPTSLCRFLQSRKFRSISEAALTSPFLALRNRWRSDLVDPVNSFEHRNSSCSVEYIMASSCWDFICVARPWEYLSQPYFTGDINEAVDAVPYFFWDGAVDAVLYFFRDFFGRLRCGGSPLEINMAATMAPREVRKKMYPAQADPHRSLYSAESPMLRQKQKREPYTQGRRKEKR